MDVGQVTKKGQGESLQFSTATYLLNIANFFMMIMKFFVMRRVTKSLFIHYQSSWSLHFTINQSRAQNLSTFVDSKILSHSGNKFHCSSFRLVSLLLGKGSVGSWDDNFEFNRIKSRTAIKKRR